MASTIDDKKWVHQQLKSHGYDVGEYDEFDKSLANDEDREWYYNVLTNDLHLVAGDNYDEFSGYMGYGKQKPAESAQADTLQTGAQTPQTPSQTQQKPLDRPIPGTETMPQTPQSSYRQQDFGQLGSIGGAMVEKVRQPSNAPEQPVTEEESEDYGSEQPVPESERPTPEQLARMNQGLQGMRQQTRQTMADTDALANRKETDVLAEDTARKQMMGREEKDQYQMESDLKELAAMEGFAAGMNEAKHATHGAEKAENRGKEKFTKEQMKEVAARLDANPAWHAYLDENDSNLKAQRQAIMDSMPEMEDNGQPYGTFPYNTASGAADNERNLFGSALRMMDDAIEMNSAPLQYWDRTRGNGKAETKWSKFWHGFGDDVKNPDFWTLGITNMEDQAQLVKVIEKIEKAGSTAGEAGGTSVEEILTPGEQALLHAYLAVQSARAGRAFDSSKAYESGQSAAESAKFMSEMMITGGIGRSVGKAAVDLIENFAERRGIGFLMKGAEEAVANGIVKGAQKYGVKQAAKAVGIKYLKSIPRDMTASLAAFAQPLAIENLTEQMATVDPSTGKLQKTGESIANAAYSTFKEYFTEQRGFIFEDMFGVPLELLANKVFTAELHPILNTMLGKVMGRSFENTTFFNGAGEIMEELEGAVFDQYIAPKGMRDRDAVSNFFEADNFLSLCASFAPMFGVQAVFKLGGAALAGANYSRAQKSLGDVRSLLEDYGVKFPDSYWSRMHSRHSNDGMDLGAVKQDCAELYRTFLESGGDITDEQNSNVLNALAQYIRGVGEDAAIGEAQDLMQEKRRGAAQNEITEALGGKPFWFDNEQGGGKSVGIYTYPDGTTGFLRGRTSRGEMALINEDGSLGFVGENDFDPEALQSYGLDQYLDWWADQMDADRDAEDTARRRSDAVAPLIQRYTPLLQREVDLQVGGSPVSGILTDVNEQGITVENGEGIEDIAWEQLHPEANVPTAEQVREEQNLEIEAQDDAVKEVAATIDAHIKAKGDLGNGIRIVKVLPDTIDPESKTAVFLVKSRDGKLGAWRYGKTRMDYNDFTTDENVEEAEAAPAPVAPESAPQGPSEGGAAEAPKEKKNPQFFGGAADVFGPNGENIPQTETPAETAPAPAPAPEAPSVPSAPEAPAEPEYQVPLTVEGDIDFEKMIEENPKEFYKRFGAIFGREEAIKQLKDRLASLKKAFEKAPLNQKIRYKRQIDAVNEALALTEQKPAEAPKEESKPAEAPKAESGDVFAPAPEEPAPTAEPEAPAPEPAPEAPASDEGKFRNVPGLVVTEEDRNGDDLPFDNDADALLNKILKQKDGNITYDEIREHVDDTIDQLNRRKDRYVDVGKKHIAAENLANYTAVQQMLDEVDNAVPESSVAVPAVSKEAKMNPTNAKELVAYMLMRGDAGKPVKINREDFMRETGYGNGETKRFVGMFNKQTGLTIAALAERLYSMSQEGYYDGEKFDETDARDIVIEFFSEVATNNEVRNYIANNRKADNEADAEAQNGEIAAAIMEEFGISVEEYDAMTLRIKKSVLLDYLRTSKNITKLAEEALNNERVSGNEGTGVPENEPEGEGGGNAEGGEVLPGEEPAAGSDEEADGAEPEGEQPDVVLGGAEEGAGEEEVDEDTDTPEPASSVEEFLGEDVGEEEGEPVPAPEAPKAGTPSKPLNTRSEAQAHFDSVYGKDSDKAKKAMRVWDLTHKGAKSAPKTNDNGLVSNSERVEAEQSTAITAEEAREIQLLGIELGDDFVNDGAVKFGAFFAQMVNTFGDGIRPFVKKIYAGIRADASDEVYEQMDSDDVVRKFDINTNIEDIDNGNEDNGEVGESPVREGDGGSDTVADNPGGEVPGESGGVRETEPAGDNGNAEGGEQPADTGGSDSEGERSSEEGESGASGGTSRGSRSGSKGNGGRTKSGGRKRSEANDGGLFGDNTPEDTAGETDSGDVVSETPEGETSAEDISAEEDKAFKKEAESIKDNTDTDALKKRKEDLKKLLADTDEQTKGWYMLNGQIRAINERLRSLFSDKNKVKVDINAAYVPYVSKTDPSGEHSLGSVVPSGLASALTKAVERVEKAEGKTAAEYVREELGYKTEDDMFKHIAGEQADAICLAIDRMKAKRSFIIGDMTGIGKGRQGASMIRWALKHGKRVIYVSDNPNLFSQTYGDLIDIGSPELTPFCINDDPKATITDTDGNVLIQRPSPKQVQALVASGETKLPSYKKTGKPYQFVMTTYSQFGVTGTKADMRKAWLKKYAKDAIVVLDECHNAAGDSNRGQYFRDIVTDAEGVVFMSATYAKRPENMILYALRSSLNDADVSGGRLIEAVQAYGVPMQELIAAALVNSGEMVRRERDFTGVKREWLTPEDIYSKEEIEKARDTYDKIMDVVNSIIAFQRKYMSEAINKLNEQFIEDNKKAMKEGGTVKEYDFNGYNSQVSNVVNLITYSLKAKKYAELAIEQIKAGEKPIAIVQNTLEGYLDFLEDEMDNAGFTTVLRRGLTNSLRYRLVEQDYVVMGGKAVKVSEEDGGKRVKRFDSIEKELDGAGKVALSDVRGEIDEYEADKTKYPLMVNPIDEIEQTIEAAGYHIGEITGRSTGIRKDKDGKFRKFSVKHNPKDAVRRFNGGSAKSPLPKEERNDAIIFNAAGSTGLNMQASKAFGDQGQRHVTTLQALQDILKQVQAEGRGDRTGQVSRAIYTYLLSPIPAEAKAMLLMRKKLSSLNANTSGNEESAANGVDADDMDNKYGDEVAREFLLDHLIDINPRLDNGLKQEKKTHDWIGHEGLLYDVLVGIQRFRCDEQDYIIAELQERYAQKIEYLNQNGINDLQSTIMDLDAKTIDSAIFIKGKDNDSPSVFAHDTYIERVDVNALRKPLNSTDIKKRMLTLGAMFEGGKINLGYSDDLKDQIKGTVIEAIESRKEKNNEKLANFVTKWKERNALPEGMSEEDWDEDIKNNDRYLELKSRLSNDFNAYELSIKKQQSIVLQAIDRLIPGRPYIVPLSNDIKEGGTAYARFIGFKKGKLRPNSIKAIFAVKDSRATIEIPIVDQSETIDKIYGDTQYDDISSIGGSTWGEIDAQERMPAWDEWWDKMPRSSTRQTRYMITGNVVQACGQLGKYKGTITSYTKIDPETGERTIERGMLLSDDFDPENFAIKSKVSFDDVWSGYSKISDDDHGITVSRQGELITVTFDKPGDKSVGTLPVLKDDVFKSLMTGDFYKTKYFLEAWVPKDNVAPMLEHLFSKYGFTKATMLIMPDSTERVDAIVYTDQPYENVINELYPKYNVSGIWSVGIEVDKYVKKYKMDPSNEELKTKIRELVQLRQAYYRKSYAKAESTILAWDVICYDDDIQKASKKADRDEAFYKREAIVEELRARKISGREMHLKVGKQTVKEWQDLFWKLNKDEENAKYAKRIFNLVNGIEGMYVDCNDNIKPQIGGCTAGLFVQYNSKYMNANWITDQMKADTILHEMAHTVTAYIYHLMKSGDDFLIDDKEIISKAKDLSGLYNAIKNSDNFRNVGGGNDLGGIYTDYGVSKNEMELLAELASNTLFREHMSKTYAVLMNQYGTIMFLPDGPNTRGQKVNALSVATEILDYFLEHFDKKAFTEMFRGTGYGKAINDRYERNEGQTDAQKAGGILSGEIGTAPDGSASFLDDEQWADARTQHFKDIYGDWERKPEKAIVALAHSGEPSFYENQPVLDDAKLSAEARKDPDTITDADDVTRAIHTSCEILGVTPVMEDISSLPANLKNKYGWYNVKDGSIHFVRENIHNVGMARAKVLHEVVAHKGLRELVGKNAYDDFLDKVYRAASKSVKKEMDDVINERRRNGDKKYATREEAIDEWLARFAENGAMNAEDETLMNRIMRWLSEMLRKIGINLGINKYDVRHLLYQSRRNLQNRAASPLETAKEVVMGGALGDIAVRSHDTVSSNPTGGNNGGNGEGDGNIFSATNVENSIFVSNAMKAVADLNMGKATGEQWLKAIQGKGGLKAGEDKWIGLSDWLGEQKGSVTKRQVLDFIEQNRIRIEETNYGEGSEELSRMDEKYPGFSTAFELDYDLDGEYHLLVSSSPEASALYEKYGKGDPDEAGEGDYVDMAMSLLAENAELLGNPINPTRMGFTTEGLTNKREIALTVPTIEPWNEYDQIHFGDAGNGRAVAWVRFGETMRIKPDEKREEKKKVVDDYYRYRSTLLTDGDGEIRMDALSPEELKEYNRRKEEADSAKHYINHVNKPQKETVLVIDEIQSKRHQEGREEGYRDADAQTIMDEHERTLAEFNAVKKKMSDKYGSGIMSNADNWSEVSAEDRAEINDVSERYLISTNKWYDVKGSIPNAPFEKNWHELAMKRMLRLAAEEGYDYVAWTTGEQQAERYNLSKYVKRIAVYTNEVGSRTIILMHADGTEMNRVTAADDKELRDIVGKELAEKIIRGDNTIERIGVKFQIFTDLDLRIGGEGMKGFYDEILPRFMDKYGKKWGVKTQDIELPNVETAGRIMHAIPVTEEMKESVMQGQLMFSSMNVVSRITPEQDAAYMKAVEAGDMEKAQQMVDDAAKAWGALTDQNGSAKHLYHGARINLDTTSPFTAFDNTKSESRTEQAPDGIYFFTPQEAVAKGYSEDIPYGEYFNYIGKKYDVFLKMQNPMKVDFKGALFTGEALKFEVFDFLEGKMVPYTNRLADDGSELPYFPDHNTFIKQYDIDNPYRRAIERGKHFDYIELSADQTGLKRTDDYALEAREKGYDGIQMKHLLEIGKIISDTYAVFSSSQIKSAEAVTYDDDGKVIPLSQRFNPENDDIRFSEMEDEFDVQDDALSDDQAFMEIDDYEMAVNNWQNRLKEVLFDETAPVQVALDTVVKKTGKPIGRGEDVPAIMKAVPSRVNNERQSFERELLKPMLKYKEQVLRETEMSEEELTQYMALKNGMERQIVFAKRDARELADERRKKAVEREDARYKEVAAQLNRRLKSGEDPVDIDLEKALEKEKHDKRLEAIAADYDNNVKRINAGDETQRDYKKCRQKEYGAIRTWFAKYRDPKTGELIDTLPAKNEGESNAHYNARIKELTEYPEGFDDIKVAEEAANERIKEFEKRLNKGGNRTDRLWELVRNATDRTVELQYQHQCISKEQRDSLLGDGTPEMPRMFDYYIPMRGFKDTTAEDRFSYKTEANDTNYIPPFVRAGGRITKPDSPFAYIGAMHDSATVSAFKNDIANALYKFAANHSDNGIMTISRSWYIKLNQSENGAPVLVPAYASSTINPETGRPFVNSDMSIEEMRLGEKDFQNYMNELRAKGEAFNARRELNLHDSVVHIDEANKDKHVVKVKHLGNEYDIIFNGDPRAAQMINGQLRADNAATGWMSLMRWFAKSNTSLRPAFYVTNLQRDLIFGASNFDINHDAKESLRFRVNLAHALRVVPMYLKHGKVDEAKTTEASKYYNDMFKLYMENGAPTGQTVMNGHEEWEEFCKKQALEQRNPVQKVIKRIEEAGSVIIDLGESIEQINRFAAFLTAMESGKSVEQAVLEAKNVTLNFNQKGSNRAITADEAERIFPGTGFVPKARQILLRAASQIPKLRYYVLFYNAIMQDVYTQVRNIANHPGKTALLAYLPFAAIGALCALFRGGDDPEDLDWSTLSAYQRHNKLMARIGDVYLIWGIPQFYVPFMALGDGLVRWAQHKQRADKTLKEFITDILEQLPVNPAHFDAPAPVQAIWENYNNKNFMGNPISRRNQWNTSEPSYRMGTNQTWKVFEDISFTLNNMTNGSPYSRGWLDRLGLGADGNGMPLNLLDPAMQQNFITSFGGGMISDIQSLGHTAATLTRILGGDNSEQIDLRDLPVTHRLIYRPSDSWTEASTRESYDELMFQIKSVEDNIKDAEKDGNTTEVERLKSTPAYIYHLVYLNYKDELKAKDKLLKQQQTTADKKVIMKERDELRRKFVEQCYENFFDERAAGRSNRKSKE